jgi:DNA-binding response OmpR family regulator
MRESTKKPVVLMVENDLPTIELYRSILCKEYEMLICSKDSDVVEALRSHEVRAVILEPALDGGKGWNIFTTIRNAVRDRSIPVIVCSTLDERKRGLEMGAASFLVKPVLPDLLLATVRYYTLISRNGR